MAKSGNLLGKIKFAIKFLRLKAFGTGFIFFGFLSGFLAYVLPLFCAVMVHWIFTPVEVVYENRQIIGQRAAQAALVDVVRVAVPGVRSQRHARR